ncbi:MAG: FISUMP domain-containing protein, partial [Anaerolineales bacterium]|nr:FISUMP domain-containing protein [Anaerolineales bacterium]
MTKNKCYQLFILRQAQDNELAQGMLSTFYRSALLSACFLFFTAVSAQEASITNITVAQRTDGSRLVDICYDLQGDANFAVFSITAEVSYDGGAAYQSITMLTGDIGGNIEEGTGKCAVWDFGTEAGELYTANARIRLTADSAPQPGVCVDYDGNIYETVQIGDQLWMSENLKTTHYRNGDAIQYVQSESSEPNVWENLSTGAYGYYNDDPSHLATYGNLYNWYAVDDTRGVCP